MARIIYRGYKNEDLYPLACLFYESVHTLSAGDYTERELNAWAAGAVDWAAWDASLSKNHTVIAEQNGVIIGFGDVCRNYLNRLYVRPGFERQGVGASIAERLEQYAKSLGFGEIETHASITARPFFKQRGYKVLRERRVERNGVRLKNFVMQKGL